MQLALSPVKQNGVTLSVDGTTVIIAGCIDTARPGEFIQPFLKELNKKIISNGIKAITLDVTKLSFLNSAGIREIVEWILMLDTLPDHQKYSIHIIYNSRYIWQESSISTFVFLNADFVSKEVV